MRRLLVWFVLPLTVLGRPNVREEHPRLFLTADNLEMLRSKIETSYRRELQEFIVDADARFDLANEESDQFYTSIQNYAFIYQLGDDFIASFSPGHTAAEYGAKAIEMLVSRIRDVIDDLPMDSGGGYEPNCFTLCLSVGYDWLFDLLSDEEKSLAGKAIVGMIEMLDGSYQFPLCHATGYGPHKMYLGALAIHGDGVADGLAEETLEKFYTRMVGGGTLILKDMIAGDDGGTNSGHAYTSYFFRLLGLIVEAWRTATGEDYFARSGYFRNYPYWLLYNIRPAAQEAPARYNHPDGRAWQLWHDHSQMPHYLPWHYHRFNIRIAQQLYSQIDPDRAALAQWLINHRVGEIVYGWYEHLYASFIFGDRSVQEKSPSALGLPLTKHFKGLGLVVMRQGFEDVDDTMIAFKAMPWMYDGGRWSAHNQGMFTIDKHGPLALHAGGGGHHGYALNSISSNVIIVTDETLDDGGNQRRNTWPPLKAASDLQVGSKWDLGGIRRFVTTEEFDYIYADTTRAYNSAQIAYPGVKPKVDLVTRQLLHFKPASKRGADIIVVYDRINAIDAAYEKRWLLHTAFEPAINGVGREVREGAWAYDDADLVTVTNAPGGGGGRLFCRTLLPDRHRIVMIGGAHHEFEDIHGVNDDRNIAFEIPLTEAEAAIAGSYRVEVVTSGSHYDTFLHILQMADAAEPAMVPSERLFSTAGDAMQGATIRGPGDDMVALFATNEMAASECSYEVESSRSTKHVICDLAADATYEIYADTGLRKTATTDENGVLYFENGQTGALEYRIVRRASSAAAFKRGDANADGTLDLADAVDTLQLLFGGGRANPCPDAVDANDDESLNIADAVWILQFIFTGGPAPPEPYPGCGLDSTANPDPTQADLSPCTYDADRCAD